MCWPGHLIYQKNVFPVRVFFLTDDGILREAKRQSPKGDFFISPSSIDRRRLADATPLPVSMAALLKRIGYRGFSIVSAGIISQALAHSGGLIDDLLGTKKKIDMDLPNVFSRLKSSG